MIVFVPMYLGTVDTESLVSKSKSYFGSNYNYQIIKQNIGNNWTQN